MKDWLDNMNSDLKSAKHEAKQAQKSVKKTKTLADKHPARMILSTNHISARCLKECQPSASR